MDVTATLHPALDASGIEELFRTYAVRLNAFLRRRVWNDEEREDIIQETFLRALRAAHTFRGEAHPATWLFRIARNVCSNRYKAARDDRLTDSLDDVDVQDQEAEDVVEVLARCEMVARLDVILKSMPAEIQQAVEMVVVDGLKYEQVAAELELPIGTIKSRVFRGRERLKTGLNNCALTKKGAGMGMYTKQILELIARNPQGLRTVEVADKVDCEPDMVEVSIREALAGREVVTEDVIAPNGKAQKAFFPTDRLIAKYPLPPKPAPAPPPQKPRETKSKAEIGVEFIRNATFDVVDNDLRRILGLTGLQYPAAWLSGPLATGLVHRDGKFWRAGPAPAANLGTEIDVPVIRKSDGKPVELPAAVELPSPEVKPRFDGVDMDKVSATSTASVETPEEPAPQATPQKTPSAPAATQALKIQMIEEPTFTIQCGVFKVTGMREVSDWNGLKELRDSQGRMLIVSTNEGMFDGILEGLTGKRPKDILVIKGHPDLIHELAVASQPEMEPA
jgi:RNA polymerase sigma-70 factor, ECF subfamily